MPATCFLIDSLYFTSFIKLYDCSLDKFSFFLFLLFLLCFKICNLGSSIYSSSGSSRNILHSSILLRLILCYCIDRLILNWKYLLIVAILSHIACEHFLHLLLHWLLHLIFLLHELLIRLILLFPELIVHVISRLLEVLLQVCIFLFNFLQFIGQALCLIFKSFNLSVLFYNFSIFLLDYFVLFLVLIFQTSIFFL